MEQMMKIEYVMLDEKLTFDEVSLDKVKTSGLVITGLGFVLTRIELVTAN